MDTVTQLLTEHLETWTATVQTKSSAGRGGGRKRELYGIKKLRELILELAVRGLLVPQDPNDEPASELLKQIQAEKAGLIKQGKIRKSKLPSFPTKAEEPFELPDGWEWAPIGVIGNVFNGNSISARVKEEKYTNVEGLPFIATKDVGYGFQELDYDNGVAIPVGEDKFKTACKGSVLICAEGGSAGKKCGITNRDICFGNKLFANELHGGIEPVFVLSVYLSPSFFARFSEAMTGIIGGISASKFIQLQCPLPPLAEQHRIVAKVDELMGLCDRLEQQQSDHMATHELLVKTLLDALVAAASDAEHFKQAWQRIAAHFDALFTTEASIEQLKQTILQLAVMGKLVEQDPEDEPAGELINRIEQKKDKLLEEGTIKKQKKLPAISEDELKFEIPFNWVWCKFGSSAEFINGDRSKNYPNKSEYVENGVPWINTGHIEPDGTLSTSSMHFITEEKYDSLRAGKIQERDLVYCLRGATFGKTAFVTPYTKGAIASSLMIIRPFIPELGEYIFKYLVSPFGKSQVFRFDNGSAQPNLSANSVTLYAFPLPPLAEQHRIVAKVDELMALCDALKAKLGAAQATQRTLTDSLVEQAIN